MYSIKCILGAVLAAALSCVAADAAVFTGGGAGVNPNAEYDTYVGQAPSGSVDTWEISLPANTYYVTIACGDPSAATGPHYVALSGDGSTYSQVVALNTATDTNEYVTATNVPVTVTPGAEKLSLRLGGNSVANRINFIIISEDLLHNSPVCASTSYSSVQDQDHWKYNYWNGSSYLPLNTLVNSEWCLSGSRPKVWINGGNPGGASPLLHAVRSWTAPFDDTINITGWAVRSAAESGYGDGVTVRIYKQDQSGTRTEILTPAVTIGNTDYTYHNYSVSGVSVLAGEKIHLHVDPNATSGYDATQLNAVISSAANGLTVSASNGYSSIQGQDDWTYEYFDGSTYTQLNQLVSNEWTLSGLRPKVWINGGNPGGASPLLDAVRTWTAPSTGIVNISGWAVRSASQSGYGDGVTVKIYKNLDISPLLAEGITNNDYTYHRFSVNGISVNAGDKLHFNIDPRGPGCSSCTSGYDATQMDAVVQYTTP